MKIPNIFYILLVLLVSFVSTTLYSQQTLNTKDLYHDLQSDYKEGIIRAEGDNQFPPFSFINKEGNPDGFNIELFKLLMHKLGLKYEIKLESFSQARQKLQEGKIDVVTGMFYSKERAKSFYFGIPYNMMSYKIVSHKKD